MSLQLEDRLQSLRKVASEYEHRARRRAIIYSLIPIALAGLLIAFSGWQIDRMEQELQILREELQILREERDTLKSSVDEQRKQMRLAVNLLQYKYKGDPLSFIKHQASNPRLQRQVRLLDEIIEMDWSDVGWKLGGRSPKEGFDSPNFAAYLLGNHTEFELSPSSSSARKQLEEFFPIIRVPESGDLVFYPNGYTMFYFAIDDETANSLPHSNVYSKNSFVIGMTPLGILTLRPDFAPAESYRKVFYIR